MILLFIALIILLAGSLLWVAVAKPSNKPAWLLALYLISTANVVLDFYIVNLFGLLNQTWVVLAVHLIVGGLGWWIWIRLGRPSLQGPFRGWKFRFDPQWLRREPVLMLLTLTVVVSYAFAFVQNIFIPQNNVDSLSTHLSRIGFWLQHGSLAPWPTFMFNQVWYPVNAQLQIYWTVLFLASDRLVGTIQWLAALVTGVGVYALANLFGYNRRQSAFAALIFLGFPLVALQSTTTQTDLVTAVYFLPAVYFLIEGIRENKNASLFLSAVSVGLGIGVKKSYFLLLPILGVLALLVVLQVGKRSWKKFVVWSFSLAVGVALFGAYIYAYNWIHLGGPFGSPNYINNLIDVNIPQSQSESPKLARLTQSAITMESTNIPSIQGVFLELIYNTPRLLYQALDTSGLPRPLDGYAHKVKMRAAMAFFHLIHFDQIEGTEFTAPGHVFRLADKNINEESHAWYGPLSALLIFPALFIESWRGIRKGSWVMLGPGMALLIFLPLEIILRPGWDPYQGRYFAPLVALCAPLMAIWFKEQGGAWYEWLIGILAGTILVITLLYNPSKPTLGKFADEFHVWSNDRIFVETIQRKDNRNVYYMIEKNVPADATLGYYIPFFFMDYPLFGEHFSRRLVPITAASKIMDAQWLRDQGIEYLLLPHRDGYPVPRGQYELAGKLKDWDLYNYTGTP